MAKIIPTIEPDSILAGETTSWRKSLSEFPASEGWTLKYSFRGAQQEDKDATTYAVNDYQLDLTAVETAALNTGATILTYWWQSYVEDGAGVRYFVDSGKFTVQPDLTDISAAYDGRTHCRIVLDAIESLLEGKASKDQLQLSIGDRQLTRMRPSELLEWRDIYRGECAAETRKERVDKGLGSDRKILVQFNQP